MEGKSGGERVCSSNDQTTQVPELHFALGREEEKLSSKNNSRVMENRAQNYHKWLLKPYADHADAD